MIVVSASVTAAVVGASGYTGGELCRLLLGHPWVDTVLPTSRGNDEFERIHPHLLGCGLEFVGTDALVDAADPPDVVFLCTPSGEAMRTAGEYLARGSRVVDLSADFRFSDPRMYERVYGEPHQAPELLAEAICGVTELHRESVRSARLVANPGCYVITAVLALAPLVTAEWADLSTPLHVAAVNGTTGAGNSPRPETMHAAAHGSMLPYSLEGHRHGPELEGLLGELTGAPVEVDLTTAHGPFARGIVVHASVPVSAHYDGELSREQLLERYRARYGRGSEGEFFVRVVDLPRTGGTNAKDYALYPRVADVTGANFCHLGVDYDPRRRIVKVVGATDNLVKGAAGSAVQNMNVMFGLPETTGLTQYGVR